MVSLFRMDFIARMISSSVLASGQLACPLRAARRFAAQEFSETWSFRSSACAGTWARSSTSCACSADSSARAVSKPGSSWAFTSSLPTADRHFSSSDTSKTAISGKSSVGSQMDACSPLEMSSAASSPAESSEVVTSELRVLMLSPLSVVPQLAADCFGVALQASSSSSSAADGLPAARFQGGSFAVGGACCSLQAERKASLGLGVSTLFPTGTELLVAGARQGRRVPVTSPSASSTSLEDGSSLSPQPSVSSRSVRAHRGTYSGAFSESGLLNDFDAMSSASA
mmetsp:Transcript_148791/g.259496  ORF Transcript_148791/g.259496 Transcript_148791/m.259496 type:complete len:284 (+) Transcript_148791:1498-2349(+)